MRCFPAEKRDPMCKQKNNPYWERVSAIADRQREKGISTYGQGIEKNPADIIKRIDHLQEELVDALMYCEWIKDVVGQERAKEGADGVRCTQVPG